ncbi:hypothetical protein K4H00_22495, partial [Mycobacterium tuberculosis]|nr:hypothetical protein [Mycobacterium tuberculosis]
MSDVPRAAIPALAAVAVVAAVESLVAKRRSAPAAKKVIVRPYTQSPQEMRRVAIHEAGHTLLYRLLPERPSNMRVSVRAVIDEQNS